MTEEQPDLFGVDSLGPLDVRPAEAVLVDRSSWQEVPQARFLSWSKARQDEYCARRDEDSALYSGSPEWSAFYLERAASYRRP
jgi:hypothetical protein